MISLLKLKKDILSTTTERKRKLQINENNHLFSHIDKLAADHDLKVTNTMIKITYKKALKDQNASDNAVNYSMDTDLPERKNKPTETADLGNSDISFIVKSPKVHSELNKGPVFHSTPKPPSVKSGTKKNFINGLNMSVKVTDPEGKSSVTKVQKSSTSQEHGYATPKKPKPIPTKPTVKSELDKRYFKSNSLIKTKSIIQSGSKSKKSKLNKGSVKKKEKLENGVKKKTGVDKKSKKIAWLKQKASGMEINVLSKSKNKKLEDGKTQGMEGCQRLEESMRSSKRPIMLVDPDLPAGWTRFIRTVNKGSAGEQYVVYVVNPQGKKFRFKWKLRKYLQRTNSSLDADQFFFGLYQRPKGTNSSAVDRDGESANNSTSFRDDSKRNGSESSPEPDNLQEEIEEAEEGTTYEPKDRLGLSSDGKEILVCDPDLPFGWKRVIHSNTVSGRKEVHIISPDGKIFRRRYRLHEYLIKHQYTHSLDRFYFGLYPKKASGVSESLGKDSEGKTLTPMKRSTGSGSTPTYQKKSSAAAVLDNNDSNGDSKVDLPNSPMYDDPNLPEGWKRFIKIRACGESAGRMEVVIVRFSCTYSPDGRRHRSRKHLEHYLMQKQLNYKVEDFDFTVAGRSNLKIPPSPTPESEPNEFSFLGKKKFTDKPVPELDISSLKETVITPEGQLINEVNGLMLCSGLSSARNERRQKLPRSQHEKELKNYLNSEIQPPLEDSDIPVHWVQRLVKCRGDFRTLEPDAATTLAETAKEFIKKFSFHALTASETELRYEDLARIVDTTECLSFLKTLIPQKITFREFIKLNRPKQFMSFT